MLHLEQACGPGWLPARPLEASQQVTCEVMLSTAANSPGNAQLLCHNVLLLRGGVVAP